ncbi:MAG: hypothetical protein II725_05430, partial [Firmicutes bacterium]|nr:hypothetical protein [Bacillota bacterium]
IQFTDAKTVDELTKGVTTYSGVNVNPFLTGLYLGGDVISFSEPADPNGKINGVQINGGYSSGLPIDPHVIVTRSRSLLGRKSTIQPSSTHLKRLFHFDYMNLLKGKSKCLW